MGSNCSPQGISRKQSDANGTSLLATFSFCLPTVRDTEYLFLWKFSPLELGQKLRWNNSLFFFISVHSMTKWDSTKNFALAKHEIKNRFLLVHESNVICVYWWCEKHDELRNSQNTLSTKAVGHWLLNQLTFEYQTKGSSRGKTNKQKIHQRLHHFNRDFLPYPVLLKVCISIWENNVFLLQYYAGYINIRRPRYAS